MKTLADMIKSIPENEKLVIVPSRIQAMMAGITAVEIYPDKSYIRIFRDSKHVKKLLEDDQLDMPWDDINIFKFLE